MNSGLEQLRLFFSASPYGVIAAILSAALFTALIYRRTNPIVSPVMRITLAVLRALALTLMLLIIFESTLYLRYIRSRRPILAVAVDQSVSMTVSDGNGSRRETLQKVLADPLFADLRKKYELRHYLFAGQVERITAAGLDSFRFVGDETDLQNALEKISAQSESDRLQGILLISDGSYTRGGNPVRLADQLKVPVYAVGIGSPATVADLAVAQVQATPFAYLGQSTPVRVTVHSSGLGALTLPITLSSEGRTLAAAQLELPAAPADAEITLNFVPETLGRQKLDIRIPVQANEQTAENNRRTLYIDVLKSKLTIMMIAGSVTPDLTFFRKHLTTDRYDFELLARKTPGQFYQTVPSAADLNEVDLFIFYDFPTRDAGPAMLHNLQETLKTHAKPVLLILGPNTSPAELALFKNVTPVEQAERLPEERYASVEPSPAGIPHAVMQVLPDLTASQTAWRALPPLFNVFHIRALMPGSEVLAHQKADAQTPATEPLIIIRNDGHKSAAVAAYQLWRWDFLLKGIEGREPVLAPFLDNLMRWLEMPRTDELVHVETDKTHYRYGDPVVVSVTVYDEKLQPVNDAVVELTLQGQNSPILTASPAGVGRYALTLSPQQPGDYQLQATAMVQEHRIGVSTTLFTVGEYSAELAHLQAQLDVLKNLARVTGGRYVAPDLLGELAAEFPERLIKTPTTVERELWNQKLLLIAVLALLTAEWLIRKRRGMV